MRRDLIACLACWFAGTRQASRPSKTRWFPSLSQVSSQPSRPTHPSFSVSFVFLCFFYVVLSFFFLPFLFLMLVVMLAVMNHTIRVHTMPAAGPLPYHTIPYHTIPYHTIPYNTVSCIRRWYGPYTWAKQNSRAPSLMGPSARGRTNNENCVPCKLYRAQAYSASFERHTCFFTQSLGENKNRARPHCVCAVDVAWRVRGSAVLSSFVCWCTRTEL